MPGRGNGLEASSYAPLTDLEPRLADAMLEALRDEGVAAYVVPAVQHSAGLTMKEFRGPLDRLWVDASAKPRAQQVLDARLPELRAELERHAAPPEGGEPGGHGDDGADAAPVSTGARTGTDPASPRPVSADEQEVWAAIVAAYDDSPADEVPRWPALEDVDEPAERADGPGRAEGVGDGTRGGVADTDAGVADTDAGVADEDGPAGTAEDEDHFVPPPPPPLPRTDPVTKAAWLALLGGPVYLLVAAVVGISVGTWGAVLACAAFVGGFVTLVARMGDRPPTDSGPDDGAVV